MFDKNGCKLFEFFNFFRNNSFQNWLFTVKNRSEIFCVGIFEIASMQTQTDAKFFASDATCIPTHQPWWFINLQYVLNITFKSQLLPFDKGNQNALKYLLSTTIFKNFSAKNAAIIGRFFHIFKDFWPFLIEISR